jgi:hypothetical protein
MRGQISSAPFTTIGQEAATNWAFQLNDRACFIESNGRRFARPTSHRRNVGKLGSNPRSSQTACNQVRYHKAFQPERQIAEIP